MPSPLGTTDCVYTVLHPPDELLGLSHSFLGDGEFRFIAPVCRRFKSIYLDRVSDKKITTVERATLSISRARTYLEHTEGDEFDDRSRTFWYCVARYGRVEVMEWAHQRGHSSVWNTKVDYRSIDVETCKMAAGNGQLGALQWLRRKGCEWDSWTKVGISPSSNGREQMVVTGIAVHVPLQLKVGISPSSDGREQMDATGIVIRVPVQLELGISPSSNGREPMDVNGIVVPCSAAAGGGHLFILQWARGNGCEWNRGTCTEPKQLMVGTSPSCSGRERMDATGTNIHLRQHRIAATKICSITLLTKGALEE